MWKLVLIFALLNVSFCNASHMAGGYFEYSHVSGNNYEIRFYFLRDCSGINAAIPELMGINDCGTSCTSFGSMEEISTNFVDYGCGNTCNDIFGDKPGYQIVLFKKIVNLNVPCANWRFSVDINARNNVDFVSNEGNYYNYCLINNTVINDSPKLNGSNLIVGCTNFTASSIYDISQTNGDQIVYDIVTPKNSNSSINGCAYSDLLYASGLNANMPFPSIAPFQLNSASGDITFTPTMIGTSYFAVRAREYRTGILIGEIVIDGIIISDMCAGPGNVTFGNFPSSGSSIMTVPGAIGTYCETVHLTSDEPIQSVSVEAQPNVTYSTSNGNNGDVFVTLCVEFEPEFLCSALDLTVKIYANTGEATSCIGEANGVSDIGYYTIHKLPAAFCPDNLFFTNRNSTSGIPMPLAATAEERIWVGDNMPPIAPSTILLNQGDVVVQDNTVLIAGIEIILPSCQSGLIDCITIEGNTTLIIQPNSCSSDCPNIPLNLFVNEIFQCGNERLEAEADGNGPFTYKWEIEGQTIVTTNPVLQIHDIVSELDNGQIPYTCTVLDAIGGIGVFSGQILGTFRFYQNITNNMNQYLINGEMKYMYQQVSVISNAQPASVYDEVNWSYNVLADPPYYGATRIEFTVWDGGGIPIYNPIYELEGGDDFSINNFEVSWNGHLQNDLDQPCVQVGVYNYTLKAKNCYPNVHTQNFHFTYDGGNCYWGGLDDIEAKSMGIPNVPPDRTFFNETALISENPLLIIPNPSQKTFSIYGNYSSIQQLKLMDSNGKVVIEKNDITMDSIINVESLMNGIYQVYLTTDEGEITVLKFVKM